MCSTRRYLHFAPVCFRRLPIAVLQAPSTIPLPMERPSFNRAGSVLYYALRRSSGGGPELWRMNIQSGAIEAVTPSVAITAFDISPDEKEVVYSTIAANGSSRSSAQAAKNAFMCATGRHSSARRPRSARWLRCARSPR